MKVRDGGVVLSVNSSRYKVYDIASWFVYSFMLC